MQSPETRISASGGETPGYSRRKLVIAAGGSVAVLAAGIAAWHWFCWADLMEPGPLGEQALGDANAPVTIIAYASLTCPHCAHFHQEVLPKLDEQYIRTGKVRFILREFPFDALGAGAFSLARCVDNAKYFPAVDTLFRTQKKWLVDEPVAPLREVAKSLGFTEASFDACVSDQRVLDGIAWVRDRAANCFKVDATPTFFINRKKHVGEMSFAELGELIRAAQ